MMGKKLLLLIFLTGFYAAFSQETRSVIIDWKQQNLVKNNRNLFNPAYSVAGQETRDLSFWNRTQWTGIDDSPRSFLLNYSGRFSENSGAGIGVFQQSQGALSDWGIFLNYAHQLQLADNIWFAVGINGTGFRRGLSSSVNTVEDPAVLDYKDDFFMILMPGVNFRVGQMDIGFYAENFFDYNFSNADKRTDYSEKIFTTQLGYTFNFKGFHGILEDASLRPVVYGKNVPDQKLQYGMNMLFDLPEFGWLQAGYNEAFGVAAGLGFKVFEGFNIGLVMETGTRETSAFGSTYEVTTTLELFRRKPVKNGGNTAKKRLANNRKKSNVRKPVVKKDSAVVATVSNNNNGSSEESTEISVAVAKTDVENKKSETEETEVKKQELHAEKIINDISRSALNENMVANMNIDNLEAMEIDKNTDSAVLDKLFDAKKPSSRYKAVEHIEGIEDGFYLVANVYRTKRYFQLFLKHLKSKGLQPEYFYNETNHYYYVYLDKYDRLSEVEAARRNNYDDRYAGETWILWVRKK